MTIRRRSVLGGLAGLGLGAAVPAWAQAIGPQSDPWAQVDPYADPRNGFPSERRNSGGAPQPERPRDVFSSSAGRGPDGALMSEQEEVALGRQMYPKFITDAGGAHPSATLQAALREFCRPMFAVSDRPQLPWEVTLVNARNPNASAFGGGKVLVHVGLLSICDRAGELAATLAHEIGHVDKFHTVRSEPLYEALNLMRQNGVGAGMNGALQAALPNTGGQVKDVAELFRLAYSREDEAEADAHEMVILGRLGVDPIHAINDQLNFAKLGGEDGVNELARTHPRDADRLAHIKQLAAGMKRPATDYVFPGWDTLKAAFPTHPDFRKS